MANSEFRIPKFEIRNLSQGFGAAGGESGTAMFVMPMLPMGRTDMAKKELLLAVSLSNVGFFSRQKRMFERKFQRSKMRAR